MKKLVGIFMMVCFILSMAGCGGKLSKEFDETEVKWLAVEGNFPKNLTKQR